MAECGRKRTIQHLGRVLQRFQGKSVRRRLTSHFPLSQITHRITNTNTHRYLFQNFVFITRFLQHQKALHENHPRLLERSVWTDKFVFAKAVSETKLMSELEYEVYSAWYEPVVHVLPALVPDAFIYLQADPEVCYERLKTRNRSEESSVRSHSLQHNETNSNGRTPTHRYLWTT